MSAARLSLLEQMVATRNDDPFPRYGLALEYRKLGRHDDAVACFEALLREHPGYVPTYLMYGNLLVELGRRDEAGEVLRRGIVAASAVADAHAKGELEGALAELGGT